MDADKFREYLSLVKLASEQDMDTNYKMVENNLKHNQEMIANIAVLRQLEEGNPLHIALKALEVAQQNPQSETST